jgi:hypothetical protein
MAVGYPAAERSYPLMAIVGEQGSAKTALTKILRALVDPNAAPARALPREDYELFITAANGHVLAFDNLSGLPAWASDSLCRLASGRGFAVRRHYSDPDEVLFAAARPVILDSIEDCRHSTRSGRPGDRSGIDPDHGCTTARGEGAVARVRCCASAPLRPARYGGARVTKAAWDSSRAITANGRFRALGERALAKQLSGPRAPSRRPTTLIAGPRSNASSTADTVAACVPELMANCNSWVGSASDPRLQFAGLRFCSFSCTGDEAHVMRFSRGGGFIGHPSASRRATIFLSPTP